MAIIRVMARSSIPADEADDRAATEKETKIKTRDKLKDIISRTIISNLQALPPNTTPNVLRPCNKSTGSSKNE